MVVDAPPEGLAVTAGGMVSSLGVGWRQCCASAFAGISRLSQLEFEVEDVESLEMVPVTGHSTRHLAEGFSGLGRLGRLVSLAVADLFENFSLGLGAGTVCTFVITLPSDYHRELAELTREDRAAAPARRLPSQELQLVIRDVFRDILNTLPLPDQVSIDVHLVFGDDAGVFSALDFARGLLARQESQLVAVGAVDSLVEPEAIGSLEELGLLKLPDSGSGVVPGEAAGFILLETPARARERGAQPLAMLNHWTCVDRPWHRLSGQPAIGDQLAQVLDCLVERKTGSVMSAIGNVNGDYLRVQEWGHALVKSGASQFFTEHLFVPEHFGDLRAANGVIGMLMATYVYAIKRGAESLVWASSDSGVLGGTIVTPAQ